MYGIGGKRKPGSQARARSLVWLVLAACLLSLAAAAEKGRFEVRLAEAELRDGVFYLQARIDYELSDAALEAISSGVVLTVELQIEVDRQRRWIPYRKIGELLQQYELQFHALSQRYVVRNVNSGEQLSFSTLALALDELGRIEDLPFLDGALLEPDAPYRVGLRAVLDSSDFWGPLRFVILWRDDFRIASDWYRWQLQY